MIHAYDPVRFDRLNRMEAMKRVRVQIGPARDILAKHVDYGLRCLGEWDTDAPPTATSLVTLILYHTLIESVDAADILLTTGAAGPAQTQGRTALETAVQLLYLLKKNDERLASACLISERRHSLLQMQSLLAEAQEDDALNEIRTPIEEKIAKLQAGLIQLENVDHNALAAARELDRVADAVGPENVRWYMVFGGPRSIRQVFEEVGLRKIYHAYFRPWSEAAHGRTSIRQMGSTVRRGRIPFRALRCFPQADYETLVATLEMIMRMTTQRMIEYFTPSRIEMFQRWLAAEIDVPLVGLLHPDDPEVLEVAKMEQAIARLPDDAKLNRRMRREMERARRKGGRQR